MGFQKSPITWKSIENFQSYCHPNFSIEVNNSWKSNLRIISDLIEVPCNFQNSVCKITIFFNVLAKLFHPIFLWCKIREWFFLLPFQIGFENSAWQCQSALQLCQRAQRKWAECSSNKTLPWSFKVRVHKVYISRVCPLDLRMVLW